MEARNLNKKSLYQEGGDLNSPDSKAVIENLSEEIQQRFKIGEPAEKILYSYLQQGFNQDQLALAFESVGYDPNAFVSLMQSTEEMVNEEMQMQQQMQQMQNTQNTNQQLEGMQQPSQQTMEQIPEGMIPPMAYGGDMFANLFMFGDALNQAIGDTTNWKNQKDQYEKGKRHRWEVDFKGANVNPKDYYVTSQGELRNYKEDKEEKMKKQAEMDDDDPTAYEEFIPYQGKKVGSTYFDEWVAANKPKMLEMHFPTTEEILNRNDYLRGQAINLPGGQAIEDIENSQPNSEFIPYPVKPVTSESFYDWLSANKPRIKDLPFERTVKEKLNNENNPFGMNYNPFVINKMYGGDINNFQEGGESYTVKSGDVLSQIAIDNNIPLEDILNANPGLEANNIKVGQTLNLPLSLNQSIKEKGYGITGPMYKSLNAIQKIVEPIGKTRFKFDEPYTPPTIPKKALLNTIKNNYLEDLMILENAQKKGWDEEKQLWFPEPAPEANGNFDIGYGHKLKKGEDFSKGLTNDQVIELLKNDVDEKYKAAGRAFNNEKLGVNWDELAPEEQMLLTDYEFNLRGGVKGYPNFMKALADKNKEGLLKEYKRYGIFNENNKDVVKPITGRNTWSKNYIDNNINYKIGGEEKKDQFTEVNPIPNQSFSDIEYIDFIGGGTQFNTANANTFTNPMNTSNLIGPIGPTGIPGGASGHYYLGNTGPGSGMGAMNFENMNLEDLRNEYMNSQNDFQNIKSGTYDWREGEDAGAWDQDPTVTRKRTVGTAMSNVENWLKNNPTSRLIGNAANVIKTGAGVLNSGLNAFNVMDAQANQKQRMSAEAIAGISQSNRGQQDLNTGLFIEDKDIYGMSKYGSEVYRNGGDIVNWFEQNNIPRAQEGIEVEIDNDTLAALIAAGANIEML